MRRWLAVSAGLLLMGPAVAACGTSSPSSNGSPSPSAPATTASPYVVVPSGTETTAPGTDLHLGDTATVGWRPPHPGTTGVLDITVTAIKKTSFNESFSGWRMTPKLLATSPFFVEATVKNSGKSDLAGFQAPLYGLDDAGQLVEASTFAQPFKPCQPNSFPKDHFKSGDKTHVCLVYLVPHHGRLIGAVYRPDEHLDAITWKGPVEPLNPAQS